jgi:allantoicase
MENSNIYKKIVGTADDMFDTHELKTIEAEGRDWIVLRTFYSGIPYSVVFDTKKDKENFIDEHCIKS